jgi:site-specific recombinase XerD
MKDQNHPNPVDPKCPSRIINAPLKRFEQHLKNRGHTCFTTQSYLSAAKHFYCWLQARPCGQNRFSRTIVHQFLHEHLPTCTCASPVYKETKTVRAAMNQILLMEGHERIRVIIEKATPDIEYEIELFDNYLNKICGHADSTRWYHRRHIRGFLSWLFGDHPVDRNKIVAEQICRFVSEKAAELRPGSIGVMVYSLRSYLRFLELNGNVTPSLKSTIPRPPNRARAGLPGALSHDELQRFLSVFDRRTAIGRRDFAMARCLVDLGLRSCEVATIDLANINWHNCILHLPKTKSRREETLPIPNKMARALDSYLRHGRPQTKTRLVFVHHRAPKGQPVSKTTVRGVIRRAFMAADLPWSGTHILRSTAASRLLESGASLKEIADVLRHCSVDTTKYYTKIDLSQLAQVALPWPGRCP